MILEILIHKVDKCREIFFFICQVSEIETTSQSMVMDSCQVRDNDRLE